MNHCHMAVCCRDTFGQDLKTCQCRAGAVTAACDGSAVEQSQMQLAPVLPPDEAR